MKNRNWLRPRGSVEEWDNALQVFAEEGDSIRASAKMMLGSMQNPCVPLLLVGVIDARDPRFGANGDPYSKKAEAYVRTRRHAWESTPGAMAWVERMVRGADLSCAPGCTGHKRFETD